MIDIPLLDSSMAARPDSAKPSRAGDPTATKDGKASFVLVYGLTGSGEDLRISGDAPAEGVADAPEDADPAPEDSDAQPELADPSALTDVDLSNSDAATGVDETQFAVPGRPADHNPREVSEGEPRQPVRQSVRQPITTAEATSGQGPKVDPMPARPAAVPNQAGSSDPKSADPAQSGPSQPVRGLGTEMISPAVGSAAKAALAAQHATQVDVARPAPDASRDGAAGQTTQSDAGPRATPAQEGRLTDLPAARQAREIVDRQTTPGADRSPSQTAIAIPDRSPLQLSPVSSAAANASAAVPPVTTATENGQPRWSRLNPSTQSEARTAEASPRRVSLTQTHPQSDSLVVSQVKLADAAATLVQQDPDAGLERSTGSNELLPLSPAAAGPATGHSALSAAISQAPQMAQQIARQMALSVIPLPDGPVEIQLSPEELGRVRMTVSVLDGVVSVAVQADRPETADLMRRHIEILAREFRDLGYEQSSFSFSGFDGQGTEFDQGADPGRTASTDEQQDVPPPTTALRPAPTGTGLDLRL